MIEAQFHHFFGVDLGDCGKSWRWFQTRLSYLISSDGVLFRVLHPQPEPEPPELPGWTT